MDEILLGYHIRTETGVMDRDERALSADYVLQVLEEIKK